MLDLFWNVTLKSFRAYWVAVSPQRVIRWLLSTLNGIDDSDLAYTANYEYSDILYCDTLLIYKISGNRMAGL